MREEKTFWTEKSSPSLEEARAGTEGKSLEAGTEAGTVDEVCLLACFPEHSQIAAKTTQTFLPEMAALTVGWALNKQSGKYPTVMLTGQSDGGSFSMEVTSSCGILICPKLTKAGMGLFQIYKMKIFCRGWGRCSVGKRLAILV